MTKDPDRKRDISRRHFGRIIGAGTAAVFGFVPHTSPDPTRPPKSRLEVPQTAKPEEKALNDAREAANAHMDAAIQQGADDIEVIIGEQTDDVRKQAKSFITSFWKKSEAAPTPQPPQEVQPTPVSIQIFIVPSEEGKSSEGYYTISHSPKKHPLKGLAQMIDAALEMERIEPKSVNFKSLAYELIEAYNAKGKFVKLNPDDFSSIINNLPKVFEEVRRSSMKTSEKSPFETHGSGRIPPLPTVPVEIFVLNPHLHVDKLQTRADIPRSR